MSIAGRHTSNRGKKLSGAASIIVSLSGVTGRLVMPVLNHCSIYSEPLASNKCFLPYKSTERSNTSC